jgi:hypothetical protein
MTNITTSKEALRPKGRRGRPWHGAAKAGRKPAATGLAVACQPTVVANRDGTFIVRPGRPVPKLTTQQFGGCFGVGERTVRRWIDEELIDAEYVELVGKRKFLIRAEAVASCERKFRMMKG